MILKEILLELINVKKELQVIRSNLENGSIKEGKGTLEETFVHCTRCNNLALKTDKYCQYCGQPMEIKSF